MSPEECEQVIKEDPMAFVELLQTKIVPELRDLMKKLFDALPSLQLQQAHIDCHSILIHLEDLKDNGPDEPLKDIPLSESEIEENFIFPEEEAELDFVDEGTVGEQQTFTQDLGEF
jgi:hypothetical protein